MLELNKAPIEGCICGPGGVRSICEKRTIRCGSCGFNEAVHRRRVWEIYHYGLVEGPDGKKYFPVKRR